MTAKSHSNNPGAIRTAFFAGSFDPFTVGHASVVERALQIFDRIVIGIGVNTGKTSVAGAEDRRVAIANLYAGDGRVDVVVYDGLTVDAANDCGACCLLRGIRSVKDFEYERDLSDLNRQLSGLETVIIYSLPEHSALSSSVVRELQSYGKDITKFIP